MTDADGSGNAGADVDDDAGTGIATSPADVPAAAAAMGSSMKANRLPRPSSAPVESLELLAPLTGGQAAAHMPYGDGPAGGNAAWPKGDQLGDADNKPNATSPGTDTTPAAAAAGVTGVSAAHAAWATAEGTVLA